MALCRWRSLAAQASLAPPCLRAAAFASEASDSHAQNTDTHDAEEPGETSGGRDPLLGEVLRSSMVAEGAAVRLFAGQQYLLRRGRPDVAAFRDREQRHLQRLQELAPTFRTRPSLLTPLVSSSFFALGAVTAVLPGRVSAAVTGGLQEALTEAYNDQLRQMREVGVSESAPQVRELVKELRDEERAVEGAPQVPDITTIQRWNELSLEEGIAAVVKLGTTMLVNASRRL